MSEFQADHSRVFAPMQASVSPTQRTNYSSLPTHYLLTPSCRVLLEEANWFAASQEIPRISRNPKVHYPAHKRPPPVPILGQPNPVHIPTSHLLETHPNIIRPFTPRSPQWSHSLRFPHQDPIHPLSSPIRATCPAHIILLDFITHTIMGDEYRSFSSSLCNLLHYQPITTPNVLDIVETHQFLLLSDCITLSSDFFPVLIDTCP